MTYAARRAYASHRCELSLSGAIANTPIKSAEVFYLSLKFIMWVYLLVAVGSVIFAFLVARAVESSGITKVSASKDMDLDRLGSDILVDDSFKQIISEEISGFVDSQQKGRQIARTVSAVFTQELSKRVESNKEELQKKFDKIIKDKAQNEEIALKRYKKVLNEKKSTEAVIRSIAEGLVVVDSQGKVIMINPAAEKLLGVSKTDKIGKSVSEGTRENQLISLVKGPADNENREIELVSQEDETKKILRASSAVIENENGQTVGMVSVLSDITKQKALDALKSKFVANVSHELRTPLVAIEKSISLLLTKTPGVLTDNQEQFLAIAARNLKRLTNLINDLLDISKLEAGKMRFKLEVASLSNVINEAVEGVESWARSKSITFERNIQSGLPEIEVDSHRIIQVITNLMGNAIKFTPNNGRIIVEACVKDSSIQISVADTGIGIPQKDLPKIFDKFYQASERSSMDISGTGLGLSIAKEIVELHRGKIWVESEFSQGARFIFTLPLKTT